MRPTDQIDLEESGIWTLADLAHCSGEVASIRPERLERLVTQAELQVEARDDPDDPPPFRLIEPDADPTWGRGLELLPQPDDGDVFLDFEGDPFWTVERGLFFLFGLIARDADGDWIYEPRWAHDRAGEEQATRRAHRVPAERRAAHPDMHVYHYNHTERSALERLAADHGVGEAALTEMVATGFFVDLYQVVRNAIQVGTESYGLKDLERLTGYQRGHEIDQGAAAVVEYEQFMDCAATPPSLERIAAYNEDDVRATLALRDWLVGLRPDGSALAGGPPRPRGRASRARRTRSPRSTPTDPDTPEHLLGDLLGYWVREFRAYKAPKLARIWPRHRGAARRSGRDRGARVRGHWSLGTARRASSSNGRGPGSAWPEQAVSADFGQDGAQVLYGMPDGPTGYANVAEIDEANGEVLLVWNDAGGGARRLSRRPSPTTTGSRRTRSPPPSTSWRRACSDASGSKVAQSGVGEPAPPGRPGVHSRRRPAQTECSRTTWTAMCEWVKQLDGSCVSIQGPPGTGKTYWGAHIVHSLIGAGRRVGITAMSHHAIDNLLEEMLRGLRRRRATSPSSRRSAGCRVPHTRGCPGSSTPQQQCALRQGRLQPRRGHHVAVRRLRHAREHPSTC